jgi:hypothetical protein
MGSLVIVRALPNPVGRDRTPTNSVTNSQLNEEWVEFSNTAIGPVSLDGVRIAHYTFDSRCTKSGESDLMSFQGSLGSNFSIRLHTGAGTPWNDRTVRHLFLGHGNYVWNNRCGDTAVLRTRTDEVIDWASYKPTPPEGNVLTRVIGTNLLQETVLAGSYGR